MGDVYERQALAANNAYIQEAQSLLNLIAQNPDDRIRYESRLKGLRDYHSGLAAERQDTKHEIALNLLSQGISIDVIAAATGLTIEAIKKLLH